MSVIGHFKITVPTGTQMVLFRLVKLEQGSVSAGQLLVAAEGLVTLTKGVPVGEPQILDPLNYPILIGCTGQTLLHPYLVWFVSQNLPAINVSLSFIHSLKLPRQLHPISYP